MCYKLMKKVTNNPIKEGGKVVNILPFTQKMRITNKHMTTFLQTSLRIREINAN